MTTRQLLALTACLLISTTKLRADNNNQLNWAHSKIQLSIQRNKSDSGIPSGISARQGSREIAVIGDDHLVRIKNRDTGKLIRILDTHDDWGKIALYHPDGKTLFTAGSDHTIMRWNADNEHDFHRFAIETRAIEGMAIDSHGEFLATVGFDQYLNLYEIATRRRILQIKCPCRDMRAIAFSPDNRLIACGGRNGKVRIIDVANRKKVADLQVHSKRIRDLIFTDSNQIVTCSDDKTVKATDLQTRTSSLVFKTAAKFYSLAYLGGPRIAVGASDNLIRIIDVQRKSIIGHLKGHTGTVCELVFDGEDLISGSFDTEIRIWEVDTSFIVAPAVRVSQKSPKKPAVNQTAAFQAEVSPAPGKTSQRTAQPPTSQFSTQPVARTADRTAKPKVTLPATQSFQPNSSFIVPSAKPAATKPKTDESRFSNSGFQIAK